MVYLLEVKLTEALQILRQVRQDAAPFPVLLACGSTSLHLQTFLGAFLQQRAPGRRAAISTGLYGDLTGTAGLLKTGEYEAAAIAVEWPDLDPRLGFRQLGGWRPADVSDIVRSAGTRLAWLQDHLESAPKSIRIAVSLPSLPLPPLFYTPLWRSDPFEIQLEHSITAFAAALASHENIQVVSRSTLDATFAPVGRFDLKSELLNGLPYPVPYASVLGQALASLILPAAPKKGLITDLDDTLWMGILGEIGADGVCWDLNRRAQIHGIYQQILHALAAQGVLVAVASKNSPEVVSSAFARADLLIPQERIFPFEVHWNRKSESVARILETWNIAADTVVFVDDSSMELAEVAAAHPGIECMPFPKNDYTAALRFFYDLRGLFAKDRLSDEDAFRLDSIRVSATLRRAEAGTAMSAEDFLRDAGASVTVEFDSKDPRVLELVNKTNQFNLNGVRYTDSEWRGAAASPGAFVIAVTYEDKYGALGKIAVMQGRVESGIIQVNAWVMSCRAFSRRIEHQCVKILFDVFGASEMVFSYVGTAKNGPTREFLAGFAGEPLKSPVRISRTLFDEKCPPLYHKIKTTEWVTSNNV